MICLNTLCGPALKGGEMKRLFFVAFIFFVVFWSAGNKSQKPESKARVEVIDGVECIHNTEIPLHPDKTVTFEIIFEDIS